MKPAWSDILATTLLGAAQGLFLAAFSVDLLKAGAAGTLVVASCGVSLLLLLAGGLLAFFFRLDRPERFWRAASQWRTSWLSREAIVLPAFMAAVALYGMSVPLAFERKISLLIGAAGTILCIALFVCTAMAYACLKFSRVWRTPLTLAIYLLLGTASGFTLAVPVAVLAYPQFAGVLALAAAIIGAAAYLPRCVCLLFNARLRPGFSHAQPDRVVRAARWAFLVLAFPLPAWLLGWGGGSLLVFIAAFVLQFAGLLGERWIFFAEAKHPRNLHCQSAS